MGTTIERVATAAANVVTLNTPGSHDGGSTDTMAYFESVEDARVAAVAMITARGWHFTGDFDGKDRAGVRAAFLAGDHEGEIMWKDNEDGEAVHVGAIYASALNTPAMVTRELQF